jgi:hypothetical protein
MRNLLTYAQFVFEKKKLADLSKIKKGALHKQLGYSEDETIPVKDLKKIMKSEIDDTVTVNKKDLKVTALLKKRANFALNFGYKANESISEFAKRDKDFAERKAVFLKKYPLKQTSLTIPKGSKDLSRTPKVIDHDVHYLLVEIKIYPSGGYTLTFFADDSETKKIENGELIYSYHFPSFTIEYTYGDSIGFYMDKKNTEIFNSFTEESKNLLMQIGKEFTSNFFSSGTNTASSLNETALGDEIQKAALDGFAKRDKDFAERQAVFLEKYPYEQTTLTIPKGTYDLRDLTNKPEVVDNDVIYQFIWIKIYDSGNFELSFRPKGVAGNLISTFYIEYSDGTGKPYMPNNSKKIYELFDDESKELLSQIGKDFTSKFFRSGTK